MLMVAESLKSPGLICVTTVPGTGVYGPCTALTPALFKLKSEAVSLAEVRKIRVKLSPLS
jgi:hypothetical protein